MLGYKYSQMEFRLHTKHNHDTHKDAESTCPTGQKSPVIESIMTYMYIRITS